MSALINIIKIQINLINFQINRIQINLINIIKINSIQIKIITNLIMKLRMFHIHHNKYFKKKY